MDLIERGTLESSGKEGALADGSVVRLASGKKPSKPKVALGPFSVRQAVTEVIKELKPTDQLSDVEVKLTQSATGDKLPDSFRAMLGLADLKPGKSVQISGTWQMTSAPVTYRDGLRTLLKGIETTGSAEVEIRFRKEGAKCPAP